VTHIIYVPIYIDSGLVCNTLWS